MNDVEERDWRADYATRCGARQRPFGLRCVSAPDHKDVLHTDSTGGRWASEDDPRKAHTQPTMDD